MKPGQGRSAETRVPVSQTRSELEELLRRYGASGFMSGWEDTPTGRMSALSFTLQDRRFRIAVPVPGRVDRRVTHTETGRARTSAGAEEAFLQFERQAWRNVLHLLEAVLIAVETGLLPLETVLLPYVVLPQGCTVGEWVSPQIAKVYASGEMPALLPGLAALPRGESE